MSERNNFITLTRVCRFAGAEDTNNLTLNVDKVTAFEPSPNGGTKIYGEFIDELFVKEDFSKVYELITKRVLL